jgi:hypothetical protein
MVILRFVFILRMTMFAWIILMQAPEAFAQQDVLSSSSEVSVREASVADNLISMDKDHDGMVSVFEVRAFIEAKHGKAYKTDVLDDMESSAGGKSCSSPFSKPRY